MTQLQAARSGVVTEAMKIVAADERIDAEAVRAAVASGEAVIPLNVHHANCRPVGVGRLFTTKINANLGRSVTHSGKGDALEKLRIALAAANANCLIPRAGTFDPETRDAIASRLFIEPF